VLFVSKLPPLHLAVIDNDQEKIKKLATDPSMVRRCDDLGFTALEIARFLGYYELALLLEHIPPRRISVLIKDSQKLCSLTAQQFADKFSVSYSPYPRFASYDLIRKAIANCPWILSRTFLGRENRSLADQYRWELYTSYRADISIRWINDQLGYGIFANRDLVEGAYVIEFTGDVRQLFRRKPDQNEYCFHYPTRFWTWNYFAIDALDIGNEARFINHSDNPNLQPYCICDRRLLRIVFFTKTAVKAEQQLTYDYGQDFWRHRQKYLGI
jgi:hypothetical protein